MVKRRNFKGDRYDLRLAVFVNNAKLLAVLRGFGAVKARNFALVFYGREVFFSRIKRRFFRRCRR